MYIYFCIGNSKCSLSLSLCLVSSLSDGASDRMGLNLSIAPSSRSSHCILLPSLFSCISYVFVFHGIFRNLLSPHLHLARSCGPAAPASALLRAFFFRGPGLTFPICSQIVERGEICISLLPSFYVLFYSVSPLNNI